MKHWKQYLMIGTLLASMTVKASSDYSYLISMEENNSYGNLEFSEYGKKCVDFLKKGKPYKNDTRISSATAAGLGIATIAGVVATAPTIVLPIIIGMYGGAATVGSSSYAITSASLGKRLKVRGKLIESCYTILDMNVADKGKFKRAQKRVEKYHKRIIKKNPNSGLSIYDMAEQFVRANEAGMFCPVKAFIKKPDMAYFKEENQIGRYYNLNQGVSSKKRELFLMGETINIHDSEIESFKNKIAGYKSWYDQTHPKDAENENQEQDDYNFSEHD